MVLAGDAAGVDWAELQQLLLDVLDFLLQPLDWMISIHTRYYYSDIGEVQAKRKSLVKKSDVVDWLYDEVKHECMHDVTMGDMEKVVDRCTQEIRRQLLERLTQDFAAREVLGCPDCGQMLNVVSHRRPRTVGSSVGKIRFTRSYGWCAHCRSHVFPADVALGLHARARTSPRVQEICALTVLHAPAAGAEEDVRRMTGIDVAASTLHREARRQGERALQLREQDVGLSERPSGVTRLAAKAPVLPEHSTLVIEIDAWNIRERDHWGDTQKLREAGEDVGRWHWVYTGTIFRLDQRGTTQKGRPIIIDRGYVATRRGIPAFKQQLYAEALQRGLLQAEAVLVIGDGAVWIWKLAGSQFKNAGQRLDLFHVKEHLWDLAGQLHGKGTAEAEEWVRPYLKWLERRKNGALDVIESLEELERTLDEFDQAKQEAVARELGYLKEHKHRMDYKAAKALGQPCGSGAIESTCSQYQRRFKLTGQFWSLEGDEALLALATLHRNGRWHSLFPHDES